MPLNVQNFQFILSVTIEEFEKKMFPEVDWSSQKVIMAKSEYFEDQERRPNIGINKLVSLFWSIPRIAWSIQYIRICNRMPLLPTDFIRFFFNSPVTFLQPNKAQDLQNPIAQQQALVQLHLQIFSTEDDEALCEVLSLS